MPIYDYACTKCEKDYTYFHLGADDTTPVCPYCGSPGNPDSDRLVPKDTSFQLKGKNWAKDRYGK